MTRRRLADETTVRRLAEASLWRVRLSEADTESSDGHEVWLAADQLNREAWARVQAPWVAVGEAATSPEMMAARRDALHRARRVGRRRWEGGTHVGGLAAGLVAAAAAAVYLAMAGGVASTQDFNTTLGERRVLTLSDGSRISLDSSSEVKVRYTHERRGLELLRGQARFDVAHNEPRPFLVKAGDETVVATGTAFNVDLIGPKVLVTLIEGRISVLAATPAPRSVAGGRPLSPKAAPTTLVAGQQIVASPKTAPIVETVNLDQATAWETGQLMFEDEALASVAARVSRYTASPVKVDADVADLRISGVFNTGDVDTFVDTVTHYLPVEARDRPDGAIVLRRRGGAAPGPRS